MRAALAAWYAVWFYIAAPWRSFRLEPSLRRVELVPFAMGSVTAQALNVLAFVPLGLIGMALGWRAKSVLLLGATTSVVTELLQLFSTRRYPSSTDLILNVAGTALGIALVMAWRAAAVRLADNA